MQNNKLFQISLSSKFEASDTNRINETEEYLRNLDLPSLSDQNRNSCEEPLNIDECKKAIDMLASGKSPGSDGFTSDFYK